MQWTNSCSYTSGVSKNYAREFGVDPQSRKARRSHDRSSVQLIVYSPGRNSGRRWGMQETNEARQALIFGGKEERGSWCHNGV